MKPQSFEPICLVSYEVARVLLAGEPHVRPSFWKVYREELALNEKTGYINSHTQICRPYILMLRDKLATPHFYRENRLVTEKDAVFPNHNADGSAKVRLPLQTVHHTDA